jgi:hypothetical protein
MREDSRARIKGSTGQMGYGTRTGRAHRLLAVAVVGGCWLAVPSGASAQQGPALTVSGLTSAATGAVAATGSTVEKTVTTVAPVAGPAQGAVAQVAGTVGRVTGPAGPVNRVAVGTGNATGSVVERVNRTVKPVAEVVDRVAPEAPPVVDDTLQTVTGTVRSAGHDGGGPGAASGPGSPHVERPSGPAAGPETSPPTRLRLRDTAASDRPERVLPAPGAERFSSVFTPLIPGPPIGLPGTPAGGGDGGPNSAPSGALELPGRLRARGGRCRRIVRRRRIGELPSRRAGAAPRHAVSGGTSASAAPPKSAGHGLAGGVRPVARATRLTQPVSAARPPARGP